MSKVNISELRSNPSAANPATLLTLLDCLSQARDGLGRIGIESDENNNFPRPEQECQFYIDVACAAIAALDEKLEWKE